MNQEGKWWSENKPVQPAIDRDKMSQNVQINGNRLDYLTLTQNIELTFVEFEVSSTRNHVEKLFDPRIFLHSSYKVEICHLFMSDITFVLAK